MSIDQTISDHYTHGSLLQTIESLLPKVGKSTDDVSVEDLGPVDEFHIGGRIATKHLLDQLGFSDQHHVLDIGCGLGGAARFTASAHQSRVTGIDLTEEFINTGNTLCSWVKLDQQVQLHQGSALSTSFDDNAFDGAYMLHVGMNIEDKATLFKEVSRVLKPGATFGVYDIMQVSEGDLAYPVPWAGDASTSKLATPEQYKQALNGAGFTVSAEENRGEFALEFFRQLKEKIAANGGPPPLGLHVLMQDTTPMKIQNMVENIAAGLIAPVEMICQSA